MVLRTEDIEAGIEALKEGGATLLSPYDISKL